MVLSYPIWLKLYKYILISKKNIDSKIYKIITIVIEHTLRKRRIVLITHTFQTTSYSYFKFIFLSGDQILWLFHIFNYTQTGT